MLSKSGTRALRAVIAKYKNLDNMGFKTYTKSGVFQGDSMSPTLFSIFINDLAIRMKRLNLGINTDSHKTAILLFADDVVILADNKEDMQTMLNEFNDWCIEWNMKVNITKTKTINFSKAKYRVKRLQI